jgi:hypothetical protein
MSPQLKVLVAGDAVVVVAGVVVVAAGVVVLVVVVVVELGGGAAASVYVPAIDTLAPAVATSPMPIWQGSVPGGTGTQVRLFAPIPISRIGKLVAGIVPLDAVANLMCATCAAPSQSAAPMLLRGAPPESAFPHCASATVPLNGCESAALNTPVALTLRVDPGATSELGVIETVPADADASTPDTSAKLDPTRTTTPAAHAPRRMPTRSSIPTKAPQVPGSPKRYVIDRSFAIMH